MKITLAVDEVDQSQLVLQAVRDLRFRDTQIRLTHVVEMWDGLDDPNMKASSYQVQGYVKRLKDWARESLQQVQGYAERLELRVSGTDLLLGNVTNELLGHVDQFQSDVLALGSYEKGRMEGILEGSVGRKAVIHCKRSILIVKSSYGTQEPLSVVLATDHSPAANRWIQQFIRWAPAGLQHIHLLSVIPEKMLRAQKEAADNMDVERWIHEGVAAENQRVLAQLAELGVPCTSHIEQGKVGDRIADTMKATASKLLVLGAQGHGFMERLTIGSVSLEQVTQRPYSVLVVRA